MAGEASGFVQVWVRLALAALIGLASLGFSACGGGGAQRPSRESSAAIAVDSVSDTEAASDEGADGDASPASEGEVATEAASGEGGAQSEGARDADGTEAGEPSSGAAASSSGAPTALAASNEPDDGLAAAIQSAVDAAPLEVGVCAIDLSNKTFADVNGAVAMPSASMIKIVLVAAFLEQVEAGAFSLDDTYTLQASDIVGGTGSLQGLGAGASVTYREIAQLTLSQSDNVGANILTNAIGMDAVNAEAAQLGLPATQMNRLMMDEAAISSGIENYTSADDVAVLLQMIYDGTLVSPDASGLMLAALESQYDAAGILGGLPAETPFAHKTGALANVRHDGGIVEGDHPFVLVTLCGGEGFYEQGAYDAMASVASAAYAHIVG